MELCAACTALNGQPVSTGRHIGLAQYHGGDLLSPGVTCQFYRCESCEATLGRQKAPATPHAVWTLYGPVDRIEAARAATPRPKDESWMCLEGQGFSFRRRAA